KTTRVYIATLRADEPSPFPPLSDETTVKSEVPPASASATDLAQEDESKGKSKDTDKESEKDQEKSKEKEKKVPFRIDVEGIQQRIVALPTGPGVIRAVAAAKDFIYYSTVPIQGLSGPLPGETPAVQAYDLKERKQKTLIEHVERFALSFDGMKLLYQSGDGEGQGA
ncbi:MAG: hypothetical protein DMG71_04160, partial [Acidobacteria bacterium]